MFHTMLRKVPLAGAGDEDSHGWAWVHDPRLLGTCYVMLCRVYAYSTLRFFLVERIPSACKFVLSSQTARLHLTLPAKGMDAVVMNEVDVRWGHTDTHTHTHSLSHAHTHTHTRAHKYLL